MLDDLVRQLEGATYDTIVATGPADRLGSNKYNQELSERRAEAVKDYLVSKNVPASRVDAEGKGETQAVTKERARWASGSIIRKSSCSSLMASP